MLTILDGIRDLPAAMTTASLLMLLLKLTLVAAIGRLLLAAFPRASAAVRHLIVVTTTVLLLALPVVAFVFPSWSLRVLPTTNRIADYQLVKTGAVADDAPPIARPAAPAVRATAAVSADSRPAPEPRRERPAPVSIPVAMIAGFVAGLVTLILFGRLLFGLATIWFIEQSATEIDDPLLIDEFHRAADRLGIRRNVRVLVTDILDVPVAWGIFRPVLLLPSESVSWTKERLRVVFLHELAHVRRFDGASLFLARVAGALFWFHPLVWALNRKARTACEQACDDLVIASGERASEYADHLLSIARALPRRDPLGALALAISRPSELEGRLLSILDSNAERSAASKRLILVIATAALFVIVPVATMRLAAAPARAKEPSAAKSTPVPQPGSAKIAAEADAQASAAQAQVAQQQAQRAKERSGAQWFSDGRSLLDDERYAESANAFRNSAIAGYRVATSEYNEACADARGNQRDQAIAMLKKALDDGFDQKSLVKEDDDLDSIRSDPRFPALLDRALHMNEDEAEQRSALAGYQALQQRGSTDASRWSATGAELLSSGAYPAAIDSLQRSIQLDANRPSTIYNLACAYALSGDRAHALEALQRSIDAGFGDSSKVSSDDDLRSLHGDPEFDRLVRMAGDLELMRHGLDDDDVDGWRAELPRFASAVRAYPASGRAWFNLGYAQLRADQATASIGSFQRALALHHRPPTTMYDIACGYARANQPTEAFAWLEKAEAAGMSLRGMLDSDRDLDSLHGDARFLALRARVRQKEKVSFDGGLKGAIQRAYVWATSDYSGSDSN